MAVIYRRLTEPTVEPLTLTEAKAHLRVDGTDDDTLITALIGAARSAAESYCNRSFAQASFAIFLDAMPEYGNPIEILPDVSLVTAFTYADSSAVTQSVSSSDYVLDVDRRQLYPVATDPWPYGTRVTIEVTAGPDTTASQQILPDKAVLAAMKLILGDLYENREGQVLGQPININQTVHALLTPHRVGMGM